MQSVKTEETHERRELKARFQMPQIELRNIFEYFKKSVSNEVLIHTSEDGVRIAARDDAHVEVSVVYINKGCMKDYRVTENHTFGLNLDMLKGSLLLLKDKQAMLTFIQNDDEVTITGGDGFTKTVSVIDDLKEVKVPEIKYENGGVPDTMDFIAAVNMAADVNDTIRLTGDGKSLVVSAVRDEKNKITVEAPLKLKAGGFKGEHTNISADYLKRAAVSLKGYDLMVRIYGSKDPKDLGPLKINFRKPVMDGEVKGYIMIAPRMEQ